MKYALAAVGFINEDIEYNKAVLAGTLRKCAGRADVVIFGEAFLQGFYGINFIAKHDTAVSISRDDMIIREICSMAKEYTIAVSFGFIEKDGDVFFSSQMTIDKNGQLKRNSKHLGLHTDKDQQMRDISGTYVLLSRNFVYLGKDTDKNEELNGWCPKGRSAVRILNDVKLVDKIEAFIKGNQGTFHRSCHKLEQCCTC